MRTRHILVLLAIGMIGLLVAFTNATAGTKVTVGRHVAAQERLSIDDIDHSTWNRLLKKHVDDAGRVNYTAWKRSANDMTALDRYLRELSRADTTSRSSREAQLAFWINAYNAVTVKGILREYPTSSIRNHAARLIGYNIWRDLLLVVGDRKLSLNDIEHQVLRKMQDPRIHFAIVCASHSCPRLLNEAYSKDKIEVQLVVNTKNFFANNENFRYRDGTFFLSSILKWYADDFGADQAAQLRSIAKYLPDATARQAAAKGSGRVSYLDYDWSLNDQATRR